MGTVPAGREKRADAKGGRQTFRSPTALVVWWVWLLFATANLIDLAVQGRDHFSLVAAAILVLATGIAYVTAQRPRIIADDAGVTIKNPLRDHHVGWAGVTKVDLADLLRVHARTGQVGQVGQGGQADQQTKVISAWAVHYSRRRQLVAESRMRRAALRSSPRRGSAGQPYAGRGYGFWRDAPATPPPSADVTEAEKIVRQLNERATAARAEEVWAEGTVPIAGPIAGPQAGQTQPQATRADVDLKGTGWLEPLKSTWSRSAIAALIIPALILIIVALIYI